MPTYAWFATFRKDFDSLSPAQQAEFLIAISHFVDDIESGSGFRKGLRVKGGGNFVAAGAARLADFRA